MRQLKIHVYLMYLTRYFLFSSVIICHFSHMCVAYFCAQLLN